jgi:two-component system response regulator FlrC
MSKVNESVLVVEDDAELREALVDTLRAAGLSALSAPDAPAALQSLESEEIALVISDVQMPGPNGYQLLSSIKQLRPDLPVVLMTAYGTVAQAVAAMREGATDYIVKPFDAQALIEMARRQLALRVVPNELVTVAPGRPGAQDRRERCHGAHHRRKRHRQGSLRALHPRSFGARRRALRRDQLRGHSGEHARGHPLRL